jgi:phosphoenolpyruvate carboxykinase (ATP)
MPYGLENHGIVNYDKVYWNLGTPALYEEAVRRREGVIAHLGPLVVRTGQYTGRSPNDKLLVKEPSSEGKIWWGKVNRPMDEARFDLLHKRLLAFMQGNEIFVQDCYAGADPEYRVPIRIITGYAWHSLFARNMFIQIQDEEELERHVPEFTLISNPKFHAIPEIDGTNSEAFVVINFGKKLVLIGGTSYAGEIKKAIFTVLNYLLPQGKVLSMHCSANQGKGGDVALFFGLSGTGKTTLSTDPARQLIGDDEHGWSDRGVFNFEGGCYAKVIRLSPEGEPLIYDTTRRFGTILENVNVQMKGRRVDLEDDTFTENTRASYPIAHLPNAVRSGMGGHPSNIIMLTADAFGVMPPIAKLAPAQARYHFLSGYTAKVGGTERGMSGEPQAVFSACFGAPFMALHPTVYSSLLGEKIAEHRVNCWLINTGWTGGAYGVGTRMELAHTRAMVEAALTNALDDVEWREDPVFRVAVPKTCPGVPPAVLDPRATWSDPEAYDRAAAELARRFAENFAEYEGEVPEDVREARPAA